MFKVGDKVKMSDPEYSEILTEGVIVKFGGDASYPIGVVFSKYDTFIRFTEDGKRLLSGPVVLTKVEETKMTKKLIEVTGEVKNDSMGDKLRNLVDGYILQDNDYEYIQLIDGNLVSWYEGEIKKDYIPDLRIELTSDERHFKYDKVFKEVEVQWFDSIPSQGILCWTWDGDERVKVVNVVTKYNSNNAAKFESNYGAFYFNAIPITPEELTELTYKG